MSAVICMTCRLIQPTTSKCAACGAASPPSLSDPPEELFASSVEVETAESGSGNSFHAFLALLVVVLGFASFYVAFGSGEDFDDENSPGPAFVAAVIAVVTVCIVLLARRPLLRRRKTRKVEPISPPARVTGPPKGMESRDGTAHRLEAGVKAHVDGLPCLVSSVCSFEGADSIYARARVAADFTVRFGEELVVVTGEVWLVPKRPEDTAKTNPKRVGIPAYIELGRELRNTVLRDGDRVRVYGTTATEAHRAFATYRDTTGPVMCGRPGAPVIIQHID